MAYGIRDVYPLQNWKKLFKIELNCEVDDEYVLSFLDWAEMRFEQRAKKMGDINDLHGWVVRWMAEFNEGIGEGLLGLES